MTCSTRVVGGLPLGDDYDMQTTLFQPVGGMGMIGQAFARELGTLIRYNAKVSISIRTNAVSRLPSKTRRQSAPGRRSTPTGASVPFRCQFSVRSR